MRACACSDICGVLANAHSSLALGGGSVQPAVWILHLIGHGRNQILCVPTFKRTHSPCRPVVLAVHHRFNGVLPLLLHHFACVRVFE